MAQELNRRGETTVRGGTWTATAVRRLRDRLGLAGVQASCRSSQSRLIGKRYEQAVLEAGQCDALELGTLRESTHIKHVGAVVFDGQEDISIVINGSFIDSIRPLVEADDSSGIKGVLDQDGILESV